MLSADGTGSGTLIFVPSYFDYVRLRNKLRTTDVEVAELCEYTEPRASARARSLFAQGGAKALLYTERCHFYHRYALRGVRHICWYGLPTHAHLFAEVANMLAQPHAPGEVQAGSAQLASSAQTVLVLFCAYDKLQLERALGPERAQGVLQGEQRTFVMH
jgi:U3 small nucleolar RNA-associated protein 25